MKFVSPESLSHIKSALECIEGGHEDYFQLVEQLDSLETVVKEVVSMLEQDAFEEQRG